MSEHKAEGDKPRDIGLKAIQQARFERRKSKHGRITGRAWIAVLLGVLTVVGVAWQFREGTLSRQKEELFAKQRAAVTTVGAAWNPLRDILEKQTIESASSFKGDLVDLDVARWDFRSLPGIYLRLRVDGAKDTASIRKSADDSARDGFVACLFRENNPSRERVAKGEDAGSGWQDQPWNMRLAYYATRVLADPWVEEARASEDEIHLRVFAQQYEKATREEIPLAIDIVQRSQFFLLVLDEDTPEAKAMAPDAGRTAGVVTERMLQALPHPSRVHLFEMVRTGPNAPPTLRERLRVRREVEGEARFVSGNPITDPYTLAAMKRQVNNCALAQSVWGAIGTDAGAPLE
jgi:hypothetical protein